MNERQQAQMRASEHERGLPKQTAGQAQTSTNEGVEWQQRHHHQQERVAVAGGSVNGSGSGSNGNSGSVSGSSSSRDLLPHPPAPPFRPFFILFFIVYIIMYFKCFNEKKLIPKICNIIINQISKIINK